MRKLIPLVVCVAAACVEPTSVIIEPLRVINWSPASGAFCVDPTSTVSATFSDDLVQESLSEDSFLLRDAGATVAATLDYDAASFTVRLIPTTALAFGHTYEAVATTDLRGRERGRLTAELSASFVTIERSGCTPPVECVPPACCTLPSDCPGKQICVNRTCVDE